MSVYRISIIYSSISFLVNSLEEQKRTIMKKLKATLMALLLLVGTTVSAVNLPKDEKDPTTSEELSELLKSPDFIVEKKQIAHVKFMLNEEHEIVVVSVKTDDAHVDSYVKNRLNYHKINANLEEGKVYSFNFVLVSEN